MGLLADLLGKARDVFKGRAAAPPPPAETHAIQSTVFDHEAWHKVRDKHPNLVKDAYDLAFNVDNAEQLQEDLFAGLYRVQPRLRDISEMAESHHDNHRIVSQMVAMPEFQNLRQHSAGDSYISAVAMASLQQPMLDAVDKVGQAHAEAERQRAEAEQRAEAAAQRMQDLVDAAEQAQANGSPIEQEIAQGNLDAALAEFNGAVDAAQQAAVTSEELAERAVRGVVTQLREATKDVLDQLDQEKALFAAYGVDEGELERMSPDERIALAERLRNDRLADYVKLIGKWKNTQRAKSRKRVINAHDEIYGLELSGNFQRMVGSEYMALAHPATKAQLMIRIAERRVLTYKMRGRAKVGQGPIIVVVDESESMNQTSGVKGGTREAWSKAFVLALLDQARRRERDLIYIGFGSATQQHVIEFKRGETTLDKVLTMTGHFFKGGTHFEKPLEMALEYAETHYASGLKRPDIVFVTDGEYRMLPDDFMSRYRATKHRTGMETYGVAIGCSGDGALRQISDNCTEITELTSDPSTMGHVFTTI